MVLRLDANAFAIASLLSNLLAEHQGGTQAAHAA